uniref:Plasmodium variant antigen protein Cir/Yir/Bir n=1 Tax=Strongyloides venezuelensis TaxID=75913 RepID=A0A0K0FVW7_STRVS
MSAKPLGNTSFLDSCNNNKSKIIIPIVGVILIGGLFAYFYSSKKSDKNNNADKTDNNIKNDGSRSRTNTEKSNYLDINMEK